MIAVDRMSGGGIYLYVLEDMGRSLSGFMVACVLGGAAGLLMIGFLGGEGFAEGGGGGGGDGYTPKKERDALLVAGGGKINEETQKRKLLMLLCQRGTLQEWRKTKSTMGDDGPFKQNDGDAVYFKWPLLASISANLGSTASQEY